MGNTSKSTNAIGCAGQCGAPAGSERVRLARHTSLLGNVFQTFCALFFASYFFYAPVVGMALTGAVASGQVSFGAVVVLLVCYAAQLFLYHPHLTIGWDHAFRKFLYSPLVDGVLHYYDSACVREGPPPSPDQRLLFAVWPHGVFGVCRAFSGGTHCFKELYPSITARWGSFGAAFYLPGVREFSLMSGCVDASKPVLESVIQKYKQNVILLPGGIDEMALTDSESKDTQLVMTDRKGYAKLAIENGCDIVPAFCFGEKWLFRTILLPPNVRAWLYKKFRVSGALLKGRGPTLLGYLGHPLGYVWGAPIKVKQQNPVDRAYLDQVHDEVQAAVSDIFQRYKREFGYDDDETLSFVSSKDARTKHKKKTT